MPLFEVAAGEHRHDNGMIYTAGDVLESKHPLMIMFPNKFKKPAAGCKLAKGESIKEKTLVHVAYPGYDQGQSAEVKQSEECDEDLSENEEADTVKKPAKSSAKEKAKAKLKAEKSAIESEEECDDVTSHFAKAKKNDFTVLFKDGEGFTVMDGKKTLNASPLASKQDVQKFLDDHLSEGE